MEIQVSCGRYKYENGGKSWDGLELDITKTRGFSRTYFTDGNFQEDNLSGDVVLAILRQMRKRMQLNQTLSIWFEFPDRKRHFAFRHGPKPVSLRQEEELKRNPPSNTQKSPACNMLVDYLVKGNEAALLALSDWLSEKAGFPELPITANV